MGVESSVFPLPAPIFAFCFSLGVFWWNFGGVSGGRDPQMCTFGLSGCRGGEGSGAGVLGQGGLAEGGPAEGRGVRGGGGSGRSRKKIQRKETKKKEKERKRS